MYTNGGRVGGKQSPASFLVWITCHENDRIMNVSTVDSTNRSVTLLSLISKYCAVDLPLLRTMISQSKSQCDLEMPRS